MERCTYCDKKQKRCSCGKHGNKLIKKIRKNNVIDAHLVDGQLLLQIYQLKGNQLLYIMIDLNSHRTAWRISESDYREAVARGSTQQALVGSVDQISHCRNFQPCSLLMIIMQQGSERFFQFNGRLDELTPTQYDIMMKEEVLVGW